jgi:hypothetical protein
MQQQIQFCVRKQAKYLRAILTTDFKGHPLENRNEFIQRAPYRKMALPLFFYQLHSV